MPRILIVDDHKNMRLTLSLLLKGYGYEVEEASSGIEACKKAERDNFDVVLTDLKMNDMDGIEVLKRIKENSPLTEVIVMTAYGTVEKAVETIKIGAYDFIQKPFNSEELLIKIEKALERRWLSGEFSLLTREFKERYKIENIVGNSPAIRSIITKIIKIAPTDTTVLITGESGTGKELVAKAIHANSPRANRPFISINCATISEELFESELFGHVKGAFTGAISTRKGLFEEADGGTIFFDEIAETSITFQAKLLRTLQEHTIRRVGDNKPIKVNVRIIAATNQNLKQAIAEKRFREDLYYRLNVIRFHIPPLRERREDIPPLVNYFLARANKRMGKRVTIPKEVKEYLINYDYPGNVRELENMIEQGVALSIDGKMHLEDIISYEEEPSSNKDGGLNLKKIVEAAERNAIIKAIGKENSLEEAAKLLGISVTTLWRKMKRYNITT